MKFEFERSVKVTKLDIKWDILWVLEEDGTPLQELEDVNYTLTAVAIRALEAHKYELWFAVADKFADYGASDSEPIYQFSNLWYEAYGEDI